MLNPLRARPPALALCLGALLEACAPLTAQRCAERDWYAAGLEDGRAGRSLAEPGRAYDRCSTQHFAADGGRYSAGRAVGLLEYCTIEGGMRAGRRGEVYQKVCADERESAFLAGYLLGALSAAP
jgi:hypothetical protein